MQRRLVATKHACTILIDPHATHSQFGDNGRLGNSLTDSQSSPVPVSGGHSFLAVKAGTSHTCGITLDGKMLCWGDTPENGLDNDTSTPAVVADGRTFVALTAGEHFTCGLDISGDIWCWGARGRNLVH